MKVVTLLVGEKATAVPKTADRESLLKMPCFRAFFSDRAA
jgi:hypothetical protein